VADDDRAVLARLAALEAEVKADADAQRVRKEAAMVKVREQRTQQLAEKSALRERQTQLVSTRRKAEPAPELDDDDGVGSALVLAKKANNVRAELAKKGAKSWVKSGIASMALGPLGWLYAGSLREAIPASAVWLVIAFISSKIIPTFLLMPVLMVALPLSGIAGVMYALGYNKKGQRIRLFDKGEKKALKSG
jgi:hypothetical protein